MIVGLLSRFIVLFDEVQTLDLGKNGAHSDVSMTCKIWDFTCLDSVMSRLLCLSLFSCLIIVSHNEDFINNSDCIKIIILHYKNVLTVVCILMPLLLRQVQGIVSSCLYFSCVLEQFYVCVIYNYYYFLPRIIAASSLCVFF